MWLDAEDWPVLESDTRQAREQWLLAIGREGAESLRALDWFAEKVEQFSVSHMLSEDKTVQAMLYQWRQLMPCDPTRLPGEPPPPVMPQG